MWSKSLASRTGAGFNTRSMAVVFFSFAASVSLVCFMLVNGGSLTPNGFYALGRTDNPFSRYHLTLEVEFSEHDDYKSLSPEYDYLWEDLLTPNGGFLIQEDPEERQLRKYGIGMFHQLHCLQMIRGSLQVAQVPGAVNHAHGQHAHSGDASADAHVLHCLDYLRQTILCMADDTLEIPKRRTDGRNVIDGMFVHQCKNPEPLYSLSLSSPELV
ncbi:hypothetical protein F5Y15DRAFT_418043 [Xylariaceae sp. FL0016]|nr:hypothetical protein F5Y15DRAFT_418043 [Xylariaceae sp. FL0016]